MCAAVSHPQVPRQRLLSQAARRLLDPDCAIKEIAQQCGYANVAYFTTLFHRRLGVTPATFRRRHTGEVLAAVHARAGLRRPDPERTRLDTRLLPLSAT